MYKWGEEMAGEGRIGLGLTGDIMASDLALLARDEEERVFPELLQIKGKINMGEMSWWPETRGDEDGKMWGSLECRRCSGGVAAEMELELTL